MKVKFKSNDSKFKDLTPYNIYRVIGIESDDFRIMNDVGLPCLYPPNEFEIVDSREPDDWETEYGCWPVL